METATARGCLLGFMNFDIEADGEATAKPYRFGGRDTWQFCLSTRHGTNIKEEMT
jgi:hypothetical protein